MRHGTTIRLAGVMLATLVVVTACNESVTQPTASPEVSPLAGPGTGSGSDTSGTGGSGNGGNSGDTTVTPTPVPKPVASFALTTRVGVPATSTDTLALSPVAGAAVAVSRVTYTYKPGGGADSVAVNEVLVASGTTGSDGTATFPNLAGASYTIKVTPPAGSGLQPASTSIQAPTTDHITLLFALRK